MQGCRGVEEAGRRGPLPLPRARRLAFPGPPHLDLPPAPAHAHAPAALYGWAEALAALLDDSVMVPTLEGGRQPLREAVVVDSQVHYPVCSDLYA